MSELSYLMSMALAHSTTASQGKPQEVDQDVANHMGAFVEQALSPNDAYESIHDLEV